MTYWNPVDRYGVERFAADLADAGGAGLITPDLIPDEADEWLAAADAHDLDRIFLVAPSSTDARLAATARACRGFVYAASTMGVTGRPDAASAPPPGCSSSATRAVTDLPVVRRPRRLHRGAGGRGRRLRRRRDRRVGVRRGAARRAEPPRPAVDAVRALAADLAAGVREDRRA